MFYSSNPRANLKPLADTRTPRVVAPEFDTFSARRCDFAAVLDRIRRQPIPLARPFARSPCDACGYPTIVGNYDCCCVCHWEQDRTMHSWWGGDPDAPSGGPNGSTSLTEARLNFEWHGSMFAPDDPYPGDYARAQAQLSRARRLTDAYDRLRAARRTREVIEAVEHIREVEGPDTFEDYKPERASDTE